MDYSDRSFPFRIGISDTIWWSLSSLIYNTAAGRYASAAEVRA
jgi:hypothetical protein